MTDYLRLYAIIDPDFLHFCNKNTLAALHQALKGGATAIQLRSKHLCDADFLRLAKKMKALCKKYKVPFIVNDRVLLAKKCGADGAHVGDEDMPYAKARRILGKNKIIGVSADAYASALKMDKLKADYIGLGPVFATEQKNKKPLTSSAQKKLYKILKTPVVAIGGIKEYNIAVLKKYGCKNFCFISEICGARNIALKTARLKKIINK